MRGMTPQQKKRSTNGRDLPQNGALTIVFTDIVDSSRIKRLLADTESERNINWETNFLEPHNDCVRRIAQLHGGVVVENPGDSFLLTFTDPACAVKFGLDAIDAVRELDLTTPLNDSSSLAIRVGAHTGVPSKRKTGDLIVGESVDKASRIMSTAEPGSVCLSEQTRVLLVDQLRNLSFELIGEIELKGIGLNKVFSVSRQASARGDDEPKRESSAPSFKRQENVTGVRDLPRKYETLCRALRARSSRAKASVNLKAFQVCRQFLRMSPTERMIVGAIFLNGCHSELPKNIHISLDFLSRITKLSPRRIRSIIGKLGSLGLYVSYSDRSGTHGCGLTADVEWHILLSTLPPDEWNSTGFVAEIMRLYASRYCCEECALEDFAMPSFDFLT
jgi:class 3 adenylate cyclase